MNINEIAQLAGVSRATVSRYLNDGYVSEDKKIRIRNVIEETGYQPSTQAQTLRSRKSRLIGVILPKINSDSISRMTAGIGDVLSKAGYQLILGNTDNQEKEEINYLNVFANYQVDGILLIGTIFTKGHLNVMKQMNIPIVIMGQNLEGYSSVYQDDEHAAYDMACHLLEQDFESPCCFAYFGVTPRDKAVGMARRSGVDTALKKYALNVRKSMFLETDFTIEDGYKKAGELFAQCPETDTILCATDQIALGCIKYLKEIGRRVPEEVRIAGLGDTNVSSFITPGLSSVRFPYRETGSEAARMLLEQIEEKKYIRKELKMGYELILRDSTIFSKS